jgi:mono/diheme cytochrome c family protein
LIGLTCAIALSAQAPEPARPGPRPAAPSTPASGTPAQQTQKAGQGETPALTAATERDLVNRYCVGCHSERAKAAGMDSARKISLDAIDLTNVHAHAEKLELVVRKLRAGMMPPAGARRPEPAVYKAMTAWLEDELDRTATPYTPPPGLHRLNRTEYANAVRDLLDLEIDPAKFLPSDDSTHGFDNIAGALGISSTLVEAYVSAAAKISRLAVGEAAPPTLVVYRTPEDTSQDYHIEGLPFGTRGGMLVEHEFPSDGEYTVTTTPIFGDNMSPTGFGSVPCEKLEVLLDNERLALIDWQGGGRFGVTPPNCGRGRGAAAPAPALAQAGQGGGGFNRNAVPKMTVRFKTTAGLHTVGVTFPQTNFAPLLDLDQHFQRDTLQTGPTPGFTFFPHVGTVRIEGPYNATDATDSPSRRKIFVCHPAGAADDTACARRVVSRLATRAYRRPASAADVDLLMKFYADGRKEGGFDQGVEMVLARLLASPKFIYRIEAEPANAKLNEPYHISDLDLASRLSFFLWSTGPDEQLLTLASQGRLKDPVVLERQVRRMLKDPRAEALAENFAGQWLNLRGLQSSGPLPLIYPDFDDPLRQAMRREVELIFDTMVREDRNVVDLLNGNYTFVNERLARHYGIPNVYGSQFRRVTLGPDMESRWGLMGKGAFLVTTSKPERTSPVVRGKWIMGNILGMSPPDPPPDVPALPARPADATGNAHEPTMRQRMLEHRVRADCTQCHAMMDPIGFSLENFDGIGSWRTVDANQPVDAASQVYDGTKIDGPMGLRKWLLGYSDQFVEVVAEKLLTYGLGRGVEYQDMPLVRAISRDAAKNDNRFSALVLGVVKSKPFQMNMKVADAAAASGGN